MFALAALPIIDLNTARTEYNEQTDEIELVFLIGNRIIASLYTFAFSGSRN